MNFIVFSDDWGRHPSSCEHLIRQLLPEHNVIWVNTIGYRSPGFSAYDVKRAGEKILSWFTTGRDKTGDGAPGNLTVISPVIIPYNNFRLIRRFNRMMVRRAVKKAAAGRGMSEYILFGSLPTISDFYKDHPTCLKIYYCVDDFAQFPGVNTRLITRMENELIELSDVVLYTAEFLKKKFDADKTRAHYFPHGVDCDHFTRANDRQDRPHHKRPVIGFFGYLSQWVDLDLILAIAAAKPDWEIRLVGGTDQNIDVLSGHANISLTGAVRYDQLPRVASEFDVGIIPFKINELTKAVNPLKYLEYMALGLPVVSTPLPELVKFGSNVYLADQPSQFIAMIERALAEDTAEKRRQRVGFSRENSWASRATQLLKIIRSADTARLP
jgi:glycosyltransferase involved in cell wall biosynthesis